jgi:hypothetical protein
VSGREGLGAATARFFRSHAPAFGLQGDAVEVAPVLSRGGFVNISYHVSDGRTRLHVKLSDTREGRRSLARWHELDAVLRRYRAPPILGTVRIGEAAGLVFPWLPGGAPSPDEGVVRSVLACVRGLWADEELATRLATGPAVTAADCYAETYHDRFMADLAAIRREPPPFVTSAVMAYMMREAHAMEDRIRRAASFQQELTGPIHGDLWLDNVLWQAGGSWWILDWDDLRIGDPAMDLAMLTGPTAADLRPLKHALVVDGSVPSEVRERLPHVARASLLDWVIDPLADWIEAKVAPRWRDEVRVEKQRLHTTALALYRELYAG